MATDFLGNTLEVGDAIVCVQRGYRNFLRGVITKITECQLLIEPVNQSFGCGGPFKQSHGQVIKITDN